MSVNANVNAELMATNGSGTVSPVIAVGSSRPIERRSHTLPPITLKQLSALETTLNASTTPGSSLSTVILDLVGGKTDAKSVQPMSKDGADSITMATTNVFVDAFKNMTNMRTRNGGAAYASTGSALTDLDFALKPPGDVAELRGLLEKAYEENPLATVQIVIKARSIHEGKGFREGFWIAAGWLMEHHPRTFLEKAREAAKPNSEHAKAAAGSEDCDMGIVALDEDEIIDGNIGEMPEYPPRPHGCFDDLNDLLLIALNGQLNGSFDGKLKNPDEIIAPAHVRKMFEHDRKRLKDLPNGGKRDRRAFVKLGTEAKKASMRSFEWNILKAGSKHKKAALYTERLTKALTTDNKFQALYLTVTYLFVRQLKADLAALDKHTDFLTKPLAQRAPFGKASSPHLFAISFAAKWVSSPGKAADRQSSIASAIAHLLFPGEGLATARTRLQQKVLAPLRAVIGVPESNMQGQEWKIDYTKVPGRCMARNSEHFMQHDPKGFEVFLNKVAKGRYAISGATLLPHEILMDACGNKPISARVAELQWRSLVDSILSAGNDALDGCLAIADVSGSMGSLMGYRQDKKNPQPLEVCIALTLLLGELSKAPWGGIFFTFSDIPTAEYIDPTLPLAEKAAKLSQAHWGGTTNFHKTFELILARAQAEKIAPELMPKKLFCFSDMQFNAAANKYHGDVEFDGIKRQFTQAGYAMPELVFWNLFAGEKTPVPVKANTEGVSLMSGFSASQMKYFLGQRGGKAEEEEEEEVEAERQGAEGEGEGQEKAEEGEKKEKKKDTPYDTLRKQLAADSFQGVKIYD